MRSKPLLAAAIALGAAGMVAAVLWAMGTIAAGREKFSTVEYMPRDAVFYMAVNTDAGSAQWVSLASLLDNIEVADPLRSAWRDLLAEVDVDWEEDIVALLGGEAAFAITSYEDVAEGRGAVMVAEVRDRKKAEETFLRLIRRTTSDADIELREEQYEGVTIHYAEADNRIEGPLGPIGRPETADEGAIAFLKNLVVVGIARDDVKAAIDVIEGRAPGLDENERFDDARKREDEDFLLWGFADIGAAWDTFESIAAEFGVMNRDTETALEEARQQADAVTFAVRAQKYGVVVDTTVLRAPGADAPDDLPDYGVNFAKRLPDSTILFFGGQAGRSLHGDQFQSLRDSDPAFDEILNEFEREAGFPIQTGLLGHLRGELALAFDMKLDRPDPYFGALILAEVDDADTVRQNMTKLTQWLDREGVITASLPDRNGITWLLADDFSAEAAAWAVIDDALVAGFPYRAVEDYRAKLSRSLADAPAWQRLQDLLPDDYGYVGYISLERLVEELDSQIDIDQELRAITGGDIGLDALRPIRAIGMTGSSDSRGQSARIVLLVEE